MICRLCKNSGRYRGSAGTLQNCYCLAGILIHEKTRRSCNVPLRTKPLKIALAVRRNVEAYALKNGENPNLRHFCGIGSASLALALEQAGFNAELVEGRFFPTGAPPTPDLKGLAKWKVIEIVKVTEIMIENFLHCWTVIDGKTIIDITFTQFDKSAPRVYVTPAPDPRFKTREVWPSQKAALENPNFIGPKRVIRRLAKV